MTLLRVFQQIKAVKKEREEAAAVGHGQEPCSKKVSSFLPSVYVVEVMFSTSVCVYVWVITFEPDDIETSFLVWCYILTISRLSLSIKVIGLRLYHGKC